MLGQRQNWASASLASGVAHTFTFDREFLVSRIKLNTSDAAAMPLTTTIKITAEGEVLYSGRSPLVKTAAIATDDVTARNAEQGSPWVIAFDRPLTVSRDYPLTIEVNDAVEVILEGP